MVIRKRVKVQSYRLADEEFHAASRLLEAMVLSELGTPARLSIGQRNVAIPPGLTAIFADLVGVLANKGCSAVFVVDEGVSLDGVEAAKLAGMTHVMMHTRQKDGKLPNSKPLAIKVSDVIKLIEAEQGSNVPANDQR